MYCQNFQIVHQEVPGELSLCFSISGCKLRCSGCHSPFLWKEKQGLLLTKERLLNKLKTYQDYASCLLFMGGEWHESELVEYLRMGKKMGYKTCLYTGEDHVSDNIRKELTWLKTGRWIPKLGGLESTTTNQKFIEVATNKTQNKLFKKSKQNDTTF